VKIGRELIAQVFTDIFTLLKPKVRIHLSRKMDALVGDKHNQYFLIDASLDSNLFGVFPDVFALVLENE
jgi:hypothetical protein